MPTILIVEDEARMRRLLELDLGEGGFHTLAAGDAETALSLLAKEHVDLVLTDLKLPGMSGPGTFAHGQTAARQSTHDRHDRLRQHRNRREAMKAARSIMC